MRVAFYEAFKEEADALREALAGSAISDTVRAEYFWQTTQEAHPEGFGHTAPADVISVRTQSVLPVEWASALRGLVTRSTGYDHVLAYRAEAGHHVPAGYLPLYCNLAVAEQAMTLWMMLLRRAGRQVSQFSTFHRDGLTGMECRGKRLLVVGVGNIGSEVARIGQGLGMEVVGHDLERKFDFVRYVDDVDAAIAGADVIVCAMNLTAENRGYFSRERLGRAKKSAVFVNVSRGELSPSTVLLEVLLGGGLAGVALDVFDCEKRLAHHLRAMHDGVELDSISEEEAAEVRAAIALGSDDRAVCTPHNAFNTVEAVERKAQHTIEQLEHLARTGGFKWDVPELRG